MRTLTLLLILALACHGENRQRMLERIVEAGPGKLVTLQTNDGRRFTGRLLAVEPGSIRIQTVGKAGGIAEAELPVPEVKSFRLKAHEGTFRRGFVKGALGTLAGVAFLAFLVAVD